MKMNLPNFRGALATTALFAACVFASVSMVSCGGGGNAGGSDSTSSDDAIIGAGSSFDNPLFSKQFSEYNKTTGLKVNYQSVGSGAG
ncbi:MAG TPA: phosphate ABC transporter substrate-binding protein PstS, partial [Puia sp.]|nr:phosphate ABC transporter substrate-binding protein PstS [Puia sp.]